MGLSSKRTWVTHAASDCKVAGPHPFAEHGAGLRGHDSTRRNGAFGRGAF
jgi:hypothetical protein